MKSRSLLSLLVLSLFSSLSTSPPVSGQTLRNCGTAVQCAQTLADAVDRYETKIKALEEKITELQGKLDTTRQQLETKINDLPKIAPAPVAEPQSKPASWHVPKAQRGKSVAIPESTIIEYCGGLEGCVIRIGMKDWDGTGRTASRQSLFFYNKDNKAWRAELGDRQGTNANTVTEHVAVAWSCYFTDGKFANFADQRDTDLDFGFMSHTEANADCILVIEK